MEMRSEQIQNFFTISNITSNLNIDNRQLKHAKFALKDMHGRRGIFRKINLEDLYDLSFDDVVKNGYTGALITLSNQTMQFFKNSDTIDALPSTESFLLDRQKLKSLKVLTASIKQKYPKFQLIIQEGLSHKSPIYYDVEHYISCNDFIYGIVDKINSTRINGRQLTQFEKFLAAQHYVKRFTYCLEDTHSCFTSWRISRTIGGILGSGYICCLRYTNLMIEILNRVNIPCLEIYAGFDKFDKTKINHSLIAVKIDDLAYNIHGIYYSDITKVSNRNPNLLFSLLTYNEITKFLKQDGQSLKTSVDAMSPIEEPAFYFSSEERKSSLVDLINSFSDMSIDDIKFISHRLLRSKEVKSEISKLKQNKPLIKEALQRSLFEGMKSTVSSSDTMEQQSTSNQDTISLIRQDISRLLDACLKMSPEEIEHACFMSKNAIALAKERKFAFPELCKIYDRELNRFLPTSKIKSTLQRPVHLLKTLMDNIGEETFKPSVIMNIKKMVTEQDMLYGEMLYEHMQMSTTPPIDKQLIETTEKKISYGLKYSFEDTKG